MTDPDVDDDLTPPAPATATATDTDDLDDVDDVDGLDELRYPNVYEFVAGFLTKVYARPYDDQMAYFRWCPRWFEHPEAYSRLEALWKAFETLRQDPALGAASWWRDYADPTMTTLTATHGTFAECNTQRHRVPPSLPNDPPPPWP